jgi:hypothetical protein
MDSILSILDDGYPVKGGYSFPQYDQLSRIKRRPVRSIMVSLMYDPRDKCLGHATRTWLVNKFNFERTGHITSIGVAQKRL